MSLFSLRYNLKPQKTLSILYIKATVSVCVGSVDKNWAVPERFFQSLLVPCGDKQGRAGRPGQPLRGAGRGAISIRKILGENRGTYI